MLDSHFENLKTFFKSFFIVLDAPTNTANIVHLKLDIFIFS